jgi:hypothetical protein
LLSTDELQGFPVDAMRPNAITEDQLEGWESDPFGTCETIFPGYRDLIEKYGLDITRKPGLTPTFLGGDTVGFKPSVHFGTFLAELRKLDAELGEEAVRNITCDYR